jgi:valyl-tRNA synthetase
MEIFVPMAGLIDKDEEVKRLDKELTKIKDDLLRIKGKLANKSFTSKAPKKVVDIEKNRLNEFEKNYTKIIQQKEKIISI